MKILVADDHTIVRDGIMRVLQDAFPNAELVGVADTVELIKKSKRQKWDVIISDITMPPGDSGARSGATDQGNITGNACDNDEHAYARAICRTGF